MANKSHRKWEYRAEVKGVTCSACKLWKPEQDFSKSKKLNLGIDYRCKACKKVLKDAWGKTKEGCINTIYHSQKNSSKSRNMEQPNYTLQEFSEWCLSQDKFHKLFTEWEKSKYNRYLKPSGNRLDDFKPYTLSNLEIMTWGENEAKARLDIKEGKGRVTYVKVKQFTSDKLFIREFTSGREAERVTGVSYQNIWKVCKKERELAGGYYWEYSDTKYLKSERKVGVSKAKAVLRLDKDTGDILQRYSKMSEAKDDGYDTNLIRKTILGKYTQHKGYMWAYAG